jgi:hypothetical protein
MNESAWAHEPEITAMAFLLQTTIVCYSHNPNIPALKDADHWAFYSAAPGLKTTLHSPPYILLFNIDQAHFEPVVTCAHP